MAKSKIIITLVAQKGKTACHREHKVGYCFDYDSDRGKLCPMAMHVAFPYIDILRYGGTPPVASNGEICFCCPDSDVINIFKIEKGELI